MQAAVTHSRAIQLDPLDNVLIALVDLKKGERIECGDLSLALETNVPAKHKLAARSLATGDPIRMYGVVVGHARVPIPRGELPVRVASGERTKSEISNQDNFIPWKRGVPL